MQIETKVLLALTDKNLSLQIIEKFKNKYPHCPLHFDTSDDGLRVVSEVQLFKPAVVIMDYSLPSLSGHELVMEILKAYSDCEIIIIASDTEDIDIGLIKINTPILDWDNLIKPLTQCLPIDFQIQYSLISRNELLHSELNQWAQKYKTSSIENKLKIQSWIYYSDNQIVPDSNIINDNEEKQSTSHTVTMTTNYDFSKFIWSEIVMLVVILSGLISKSWWGVEESYLNSGLQYFLFGLLIINGLGFFLIRLFSRASKI